VEDWLYLFAYLYMLTQSPSSENGGTPPREMRSANSLLTKISISVLVSNQIYVPSKTPDNPSLHGLNCPHAKLHLCSRLSGVDRFAVTGAYRIGVGVVASTSLGRQPCFQGHWSNGSVDAVSVVSSAKIAVSFVKETVSTSHRKSLQRGV
jgi:hypothetical protein